VAVAAVDTTVDPARRARFTNYGWWVDVCAPGVDLRSTYVAGTWQTTASDPKVPFAGWACWSGTSFAAPQVAARIAARVKAGMSPRHAVLDLLSGLDPFSDPELGLWLGSKPDLTCPRG
jgi:subtilisin family serine protease